MTRDKQANSLHCGILQHLQPHGFRHRQPMAAFLPAAAQNIPATLRFHPGPKAMRPNSLDVAGLISSFHFSLSYFILVF